MKVAAAEHLGEKVKAARAAARELREEADRIDGFVDDVTLFVLGVDPAPAPETREMS